MINVLYLAPNQRLPSMRFLAASRLFSGHHFANDAHILAVGDDGSILDLLPAGSVEAGRIEQYDGILCPGFVNTHCHLELSHLKNRIPRHTGIVDFGLSVVRQRQDLPEEAQLEQMQDADREMARQGIVAVGDISNTVLSASVKQQSRIHYHSFVELIALNPLRATQVFDAGLSTLDTFYVSGLSASLAPHAPYSCSPKLVSMIADYCHNRGLPTSIHNQESQAENDFFRRKTGDYLRLYSTLGLELDFFNASGKSSLMSLLDALKHSGNTLLVHNTFTTAADVEAAQQQLTNLYWCLCPNANVYIENTLPDVAMLYATGCTLTIGTDSLASNNTLSVWDELLLLQKEFPAIPIETWLEAATANGADFLGISGRYGTFEKGKMPGVNLVDPANGSVKVLA